LSRSLSICECAAPKCKEALASAPVLLGPSVAYLRQSSASLLAAKEEEFINLIDHQNNIFVLGKIKTRNLV